MEQKKIDQKKLGGSFLFIAFAVITTYLAGKYVDATPSAEVPDLLITLLPEISSGLPFELGIIFFIGLLVLYPLYKNPASFPAVLNQLSLLSVTRNVFITLTHLKMPANTLAVSFPTAINTLNFQNDLFFSGHVAIPFLGFLLFPKSNVKWLFLVGSIVLGIISIMSRRHYSIDVFAAYFITYGTYSIGKKIWKE